MRISLHPLALFTVVACALLASTLEAQRPEIMYHRFNEGSGSNTSDLGTPGLAGTNAIVSNGTGWNSNLQKLGASCINTTPAFGVPVQTNKVFSLSGDWTIEIWAYDNDNSNPLNNLYLFGDASANAFRCFRGGIGGANNVLLRANGMEDVLVMGGAPFGVWTHLCFVYDSRALTITPYLNGVALPPVRQYNPQAFVGTAPTGLEIGGYGTALPWIGLLDEFRIWNRALTTAEVVGQFNVQVLPQANDVALASITSPVGDRLGCMSLSATEVISFEVSNTGTTTIPVGTLFQASYTINGGTPVIEPFLTTTALTTGKKETFSFITTANMAAAGDYNIQATVIHTGDLIALNNNNARTVGSGGNFRVSSFPYTETFDSALLNGIQATPLGWSQDRTDGAGVDADWYFRNLSTPSGGTGPLSDHTGGGYYAHVEDDGNFAAVNLLSPCFDFSSLTNPRLKFYVHSNSSVMTTLNSLSVDVIAYPGGVITMDAVGPIGFVGTSWAEYFVDLPAFAGQIAQFRFRGRSNGGGTNHDIAIDDISVFNYIPGIGQAPQATLAVLDVSNAKSSGFSGVSSLDNGPYITSIAGGEQINFVFSGEANQAVVMLFGALNPAAASFPGIGQLDIGGPIDVMTGVPTLITVFADGTSPMGFNPFFNTGPAAQNTVYFTMPPFPSGPLTTFQAVIFRAGGVAISNAVEVSIP